MLEMDQVVECKQLRAREVGIRAIARQLEISRNTVRCCWRSESAGIWLLKSAALGPGWAGRGGIRGCAVPRVIRGLRLRSGGEGDRAAAMGHWRGELPLRGVA